MKIAHICKAITQYSKNEKYASNKKGPIKRPFLHKGQVTFWGLYAGTRSP